MSKLRYSFFLVALAASSGAVNVAAQQAGAPFGIVPGLRAATAIGEFPAVARTMATASGQRVWAELPAGSSARELGPALRGDDGAPALAALPGGGFLVIAARWQTNGAQLWAQHGDDRGWNAPRQLRHAGISDHHPVVAAGDQNVWVTWVSETGDDRSLMAARWNGQRLTAPERVPAGPGKPGMPALAVDRDDEPVVVWSAFDGNDTEVWISRRSSAGWSAPAQLTDNDVPDEFPSIGRGRHSRLVVAWGHYTPSGYQPFATREGDAANDFPAASRLDTAAVGHATVLGGPDDTIAWTAILPTTYDLRVAGRRGRRWQEASRLGQIHTARPSAALREDTLVTTTGRGGHVAGTISRSRGARHGGADLGLAPVAVRSMDKAAAGAPVPLLPGTYRGFGDSITQGIVTVADVPTITEGYVVLLADYIAAFLGRTKITVENSGIGGEATSEGLGRLVGLNSTAPRVYTLIMEGANDASTLVDANTVATNLRGMVLSTQAAGSIPVLSTVTPRTSGAFNGGLNPAINAYNDLIRAMAARESALLVDQNTAFYKQASLFSDPIHPNPDGYTHMAATWFRGLQPFFTALLTGEEDAAAALRDALRRQRQRPEGVQ